MIIPNIWKESCSSRHRPVSYRYHIAVYQSSKFGNRWIPITGPCHLHQESNWSTTNGRQRPWKDSWIWLKKFGWRNSASCPSQISQSSHLRLRGPWGLLLPHLRVFLQDLQHVHVFRHGGRWFQQSRVASWWDYDEAVRSCKTWAGAFYQVSHNSMWEYMTIYYATIMII